MKHSAKRIEDGIYEYRGIILERNDYVSTCDFDRWETSTAIVNHRRIYAETLRGLKKRIDNILDK